MDQGFSAKIPEGLIDPKTGNTLLRDDDRLVDPQTGRQVAAFIDGAVRFADVQSNYAESFGWQWNHWRDERSAKAGSSLPLHETLLGRFHFDKLDLDGKTLLECGMGGGDDTEILLQYPFGEIHSFDISNSIDRAISNIKDNRLYVLQASIEAIPYPDEHFDAVYCHRVLQHTPNPKKSLVNLCRKVKPGGYLFIHSYKKSFWYMMEWRYRIHWLTKRLPRRYIFWYVTHLGRPLHQIKHWLTDLGSVGAAIAHMLVPWHYVPFKNMPKEERLDLERLVTFDALTPAHDHPMRSSVFFNILAREGFDILYKADPPTSPITAVAQKKA